MGRQQSGNTQSASRPKRRATNAHIFRYLQTRNPSKLEENDLKRALEASLEECPDFWPEDSASCSSSEQTSSLSSRSSNSSTSRSRLTVQQNKRAKLSNSSSSSMQQNHLNHNHHLNNYHHSFTANTNCCCPNSSVHKRYKPVAKKNIYTEADFFHDGIMEYIEYELLLAKSKREALKKE